MRLIDADALKKIYMSMIRVGNKGIDKIKLSTVINELEMHPTVDAVPVVHGRWVYNGIPESMLNGCSVCGFSCGAYTFNFCPNCGAKMDGKEE